MQIILFVLLVIIVFIILLTIGFKRWKKSAIRVMDDGEVMETAMGKIHYKLTGEGFRKDIQYSLFQGPDI